MRRESCAALEAKGARYAASPAAVGDAVDTVLLSLPTPPIVRDVAFAVASGGKVKTVIDLSTTGATMAREIAAALAPKGITAVDSPVSGGVSGAVKATLAVMVACPKALFADLEPMLKHIGKVFFIGERPGMGQTMKLCNNLLSATATAASSEAIVFGDINDPKSQVAQLKAQARNYSLLEDLNVRPRTTYLGRLKNPNPEIERG